MLLNPYCRPSRTPCVQRRTEAEHRAELQRTERKYPSVKLTKALMMLSYLAE